MPTPTQPSPLDLNAPLNPLSSSVYDFGSLQYPLDLATNPEINHYMCFFINQSNNTNYTTSTSAPDQSQASNALSSINANQTGESLNGSTPRPANTSRDTTRTSAAIALYMPPNIAQATQTPWGRDELGLAGNLYQDFFKSPTTSYARRITNFLSDTMHDVAHAGGQGLDKFNNTLLNVSGTVSLANRMTFNPQAEVLFQGINFRGFRFSWQFFPRSEDEAKAVKNIIYTFKFNSAPEVSISSSGRFWIYPAEFDIKFYSYGKENNFIPKISTCALVSISTNFGGNTFTAFQSGDLQGVPTETYLTLDFVEVELITKNRVQQGY